MPARATGCFWGRIWSFLQNTVSRVLLPPPCPQNAPTILLVPTPTAAKAPFGPNAVLTQFDRVHFSGQRP